MRTTLFRRHALQHQHHRLPGDVLLTPRLSYAVITGIVLVWLVALVFFLSTQQYSRQATVTGWLEPDSGQIRLFTKRQGTVSRVLVTEGTRVDAGTAIIELQAQEQMRDGENVQDKQIEELLTQARRVQSQQAHLDRLFTQQRSTLRQQLVLVDQDLETLQTMMALAEQRKALAQAQRLGMLKLQQDGYVAQRDVSLSTAESLQLQQEFQQLKREQTALSRERDETTAALHSLPDELAKQRLTLENQHSDIQQRLVQLESQRSTIVAASRAGIVSQIDARPGQQLSPGQLVMTLLPDNVDIKAKMVVPVTAAGFLSQGQQVNIRYDAFPFQKYGLHQGVITRISDTLVLPGDWPDAPVSLSQPGYLVKVDLASTQLTAHGNVIDLKSGMTFSADVHLGQRSLLEWLLEPLLTIRGRV